MRESFSIAHYCRSSKVSKKSGLAPIEMSVSVNGKRIYICLPRKEEPAKFAKAMMGKRSNDIKEFCNLWYGKVNEIVLNLMREGKDVTAENIKLYLNGGEKKEVVTCLRMWNDFMKSLGKKMEVEIAMSTFQKYMNAKKYFLNEVGEDTDIEDLTSDTIRDIYFKLRKEVSINVAAKYIQKFKACLKSVNKEHLFDGIKVAKEVKEVVTFTESDYLKIKSTDFAYDSLNRMKDLLVFICNSGLSYADIRELKPNDINVDADGNVTIVKARVKTGTTFYSVVLPEGVEILKKYKNELPKISNQKGNLLLHTIEGIVGASASITFHKCRHFYATRLIASGVPIEVIQKALGHNKVTTTAIYSHILEDTVKKSILSKLG